MSSIGNILGPLGKRKDVILAILLVSIVFMMILPLPTALVDVLIGTNMGLAVILLMLAVYISGPLDFSSFPAVLLLTTLFRLALGITTTRLILLDADAGEIINAFGNFVVGGNLIVGIVIFLIITIVQFIVITKGAERVAEVSARFSLDAMPGKQMSIDGDMRAGNIDMDEARHRRELVQRESQLYGSMDGAMKFVKGDAIAGLIIIAVNIIGGISIGVLQQDMSAGDALELYTILTIGDGLVSQIPALLISMTAGFIVTRVSDESSKDLGTDIGGQLTSRPRALMIGGGLLLAFAMIPGFPTLTFVTLALVVGGAGWYMHKNADKAETEEIESTANELPALTGAGKTPPKQKMSEQEEFALTVPLLVDVALNLEGDLDKVVLNEELVKVRRALYLDLGVPFPGMHLRFNHALQDDHYDIMMNEVPVATGEMRPNSLLVLGSTEQLDILEIPYQETSKNIGGNKGYWVDASQAETLEKVGVSYLNSTQVITFHLSFVLKRFSEEFIGIQETRYLLEKMEETFPELIREAQRVVPIQKIKEIFQRLVSEDISIRNLRLILESLVEWGPKEKDTVVLVEYIRNNLRRQISYKHSNGQNILPAYLLEQDVEDAIRAGIRQTSAGAYLALEPQVTNNFVTSVKNSVGDISNLPNKPVLLTSMDIRRYVRKLVEMECYDLSVLSHQEITPEISIQPLGRINI
ncbi:type III secretion system export apparatus subunit SctV [Pleionea sp. CnH1-48]|uniref:type III secretion system export apparatus subunit SctV n=1 Tax=Pleionea sp. CnH1-48 TaxID=2954494 RepID=UPI0020968CDB|nr:type III secretion system export apparatus subunit SctV [Pleionea sp. CnH1-48]MCO7226982.1 type III secretion system export apparatus subunit SctV [Pleionea sp. CnH1-48]